ncbi:MAG: hypothetical protein Q9218_003768, partial [Villophora microphyllina]
LRPGLEQLPTRSQRSEALQSRSQMTWCWLDTSNPAHGTSPGNSREAVSPTVAVWERALNPNLWEIYTDTGPVREFAGHRCGTNTALRL